MSHKAGRYPDASAGPDSWESFFQLVDELGAPEDFMSDREDEPAQERDWASLLLDISTPS